MDLSRNLVKMAKIKNHNNFDLKKKSFFISTQILQ